MNILQKVIKFLIRETKEQNIIIALYPTAETVSHIVAFREEIKKKHNLSSMREINPEDLHATIRWWPVKEEKYHKIAFDLSLFRFKDLVTAEIQDVDILGDSLSLMFNSVGMHRLFDKVDNLVQGHGGPPSTFPDYKPHLALFYGDWDNVIVDQVTEIPNFPVIFDRIKMKDNMDNIFVNRRLKND